MAEYDQYCNIPDTSPWFPTAPGVTEPSLPVTGEIIANPSPAPPNAVEAPLDFDENNPDLCVVFDGTLSNPSAPVFPEEIDTAVAIPPYTESVSINTVVKIKCSLDFLGYAPELFTKELDAIIKITTDRMVEV